MTEQENPPAAEETAPAPSPAPWWRRRWAIASAALAVAVAAVGITLAVTDDEPEDAVADYLDVLKAGDAEAALEYAEDVDLAVSGTTAAFLTSEAMATDWTATRVVRRHTEDDEPATVDVTITAADGTSREGRFELTLDDGDWTITNPLVRVRTDGLPMTYTEFNGVSADADEAWLFPGAYRAYGSLDFMSLSAPTYVAVPAGNDYSTGEAVAQVYLPLVHPTDATAAEVDARLREWVDACAASTDPYPQACPFSAGLPDFGEIFLESGEYQADEVTWEVVTYPVVVLEQLNESFKLIVVHPGEIRVSGHGTDVHDEGGAEKDFSGRCDITPGTFQAVVNSGGVLAFIDHGGLGVSATCAARHYEY